MTNAKRPWARSRFRVVGLVVARSYRGRNVVAGCYSGETPVMRWRQISDDVALMQYPFRVLGIDFARNVTLLRLRDGRVVIHSTAPFSPSDVDAIRNFGTPAWLVDATVMHDTFARQGRAAFPDIPYL